MLAKQLVPDGGVGGEALQKSFLSSLSKVVAPIIPIFIHFRYSTPRGLWPVCWRIKP